MRGVSRKSRSERAIPSYREDQHLAVGRRMVWVNPANLRATINAARTLEIASALRNAGWRVDLLVGGKVAMPQATEIEGVEAYEIPLPRVFLARQVVYHLLVLRYVLREWSSIDVVLFMPMSLPWMLLLRASQILRSCPSGGSSGLNSEATSRPLLVMDTRTMPMSRSTGRDYVRGLYLDAMNHLANRFADGQTAITPALARAYRMPEDRLLGIWPSGVDIELFAPAREKRRWPEADDPVRLVFVGSLETAKPLLPLCRAVEVANREGMHFELSFVGDGPAREGILDRAARSPGLIRYLGRIPYHQVPDVLAATHLGVLPCPDTLEYQVESPIKLFEYLAAGLPVLASRVSCHTDVLGDSPCAFWVDDITEDSFLAGLRRVWNDRLSLATLSDHASSLAVEYTWSASAQKLADALERGLASPGSRLRLDLDRRTQRPN